MCTLLVHWAADHCFVTITLNQTLGPNSIIGRLLNRQNNGMRHTLSFSSWSSSVSLFLMQLIVSSVSLQWKRVFFQQSCPNHFSRNIQSFIMASDLFITLRACGNMKVN
jgi:hypothetical protein